MKNSNSIGMLALFIAICFAVSGAGAIVTGGSVNEWYPALAKPSWNPPSWVFGPVWTLLYLMMAFSAWLVWRKRGFKGGGRALGIFAFQLLLNAAWSPLFFGLRNPLAGLVDIIPLWAAIMATIVSFWKISRSVVESFGMHVPPAVGGLLPPNAALSGAGARSAEASAPTAG
jgi:tryptophan-rich sensory protein